ncbi:hypothetical protein AGABI2DRAFT_176818 [Agaricus bisporus var. bisporus H97]|uniref:hypothetical protein n=1 Tax=Agaricus bisporus var. bisporus (strain H97 / ATCC MYA-4626 / FGSC 10389) TaxID=936046 RepID=UPI00029F640D|nr:hypothetical protein AGABI2DRAFT_176818 [Agaricus bisporus var. bisporus H97]EKV50462.1 hypothetical protein AGABI2DRAFT_176818 [Agaricus bisporus var. bisporus H97]
MTWQDQYATHLLKTLRPLLTVPHTPYHPTHHELSRLRHRAKVCDDLADALRQSSAQVKFLINASASPIFRLPNEILSEIMLWACDIPELTQFKPFKYQRFGKHMSPIVLGQVCHRWKQVSQSDARLWTFLWVDLTFETSLKDVKRVEYWFKMAKQLPVVVNISHNDDTRLVDEVHSEKLLPDWQPCQQVLETLFHHSSRIGSLFFGILDGGWGDLLKRPLDFARLKHLTIYGEVDPAFAPTEVYMFYNAPRLESVDLWAVEPGTLRLPWNTISSLRISWTKFHDLVAILRLTPNLCSLRVRNLESTGDEREVLTEEARYDPVNLPVLRTLEVTDDPANVNILDLFWILLCPSLAVFKYNTFGSPSYSPNIIHHLIHLLRQSNKLHTLDASGIRFQRDDLRCLLHSVPTLHSLYLDISHNSEVIPDSTAMSFLQLLHRHDLSGQYETIPHLRHLELEVNSNLPFNSLFAAFETRCPQPYLNGYTIAASVSDGGYHHLESVRVKIHAPLGHVAPVEWKFWLDSLCERGLPVHLNVPFDKTPITFVPALSVLPAFRNHALNFVDVL